MLLPKCNSNVLASSHNCEEMLQQFEIVEIQIFSAQSIRKDNYSSTLPIANIFT